jgi:Bacterial Ig-like domain (group 1)
VALTLTASQPTIQSGATNNTAVVTVTAHKFYGAVVPNQLINFSVSNNGQLTSASGVTDANGQTQTTVSYGPDKSNRVLVVTAEVPSSTSSLHPVTVTGTSLEAIPGNDLVQGSADTSSWSIRLTDADGQPIQQPVQIEVHDLTTSSLALLNFDLSSGGQVVTQTIDSTGFTRFDMTAGSRPYRFPYAVVVRYGSQSSREDRSVQSKDSNATVTEGRGTNLPRTAVGSSKPPSVSWLVPQQGGAVGPTKVAYGLTGYADIDVNVLAADGNPNVVHLRGTKATQCSVRPMNDTVGCSVGPDGTLRIWYEAADNLELPAGTYSGQFWVKGVYGSTVFQESLDIFVSITKQ